MICQMEPVMTRREMMCASALVIGGACSCRMAGEATVARSTCCDTPDLEPESLTVGQDSLAIDLKKAVSLHNVGDAAWITCEDKGLKLIIVRAARKQYFVLSRLCTHGGQTVSYNHRRRLLQCNNFNHSHFALSGEVVKGPAETPLKSYPVRLADDRFVVVLSEAVG